MAADVPSPFVDLLEIATYVYCADQVTKRGGEGVLDYGSKWRRNLRFYIPVRNPQFWGSKQIKEVMQDTLSFLSDDVYEFKFRKLHNPQIVQGYINFGTGPAISEEKVIMFSGGLDSLAGAAEEALINNRNVALVSHWSAPKTSATQSRLVQVVQKRCQSDKLYHVPVWINKDSDLSNEFSQRSRSFLYACLGATVANMLGLDAIYFFENGITSFNLSISGQALGSRATRVTHPKTLRGFSNLFSLLRNTEFKVENPFLWKTKAEIIERIDRAKCSDLIKHTVSCSHIHVSTKLNTHCGVCLQCVTRRFAVLAAGLGKHDPSVMYSIDIFTQDIPEGKKRTLVESFVRTADKIAGETEDEFYNQFLGEISKTLNSLEGPTEENLRMIIALHKRHSNEVGTILSTEHQKHAIDLREGNLPGHCLLALTLHPKYKTIEIEKRSGYIFRKEGEKWVVCFDGQTCYLDNSVGLAYIALLLRYPASFLSAQQVYSIVRGLAGDVKECEITLQGLTISDRDSEDEIVDKRAAEQFRTKLEKLKEELEFAEKSGDVEREASVQYEIDKIGSTVSASIGLKGRGRKFNSQANRARVSVTKAINTSLDTISQYCPPCGDFLKTSIKTGHFCSYNPPQGININWAL